MLDKKIIKLSIKDRYYPKRLKDKGIDITLYAMGNIDLLNSTYTVSIVGSRDSIRQALEFTEELSKNLSLNRVTVISGGALGVDSYAHRGALKGEGGTVVVLGSGLNLPYPQRNFPLFREILNKGGLLLSQFESDTPPFRFNFIKRNFLISALSDIVVVVRAGAKSGTFHTVRSAIKLDKKIGIVPGNPWERDAKGINSLLYELKDRISIIRDHRDILKILGIYEDGEKGQLSLERLDDLFLKNLPKEYRNILRLLERRPYHWDELIDSLNISPQKLSTIILDLELNNIIKDIGNKTYILLKESKV